MPHCCKVSSTGGKNTICPCMVRLSDSFLPGPFDVICGQGKSVLAHVGNKRYQKTIQGYLERYIKATRKVQKISVVSEIVTAIRMASPDGGFVRLKCGAWYEVGDHAAREKVSQNLRDILYDKYNSSSRSKADRRRRAREKLKLNGDRNGEGHSKQDKDDDKKRADERGIHNDKEKETSEYCTIQDDTVSEDINWESEDFQHLISEGLWSSREDAATYVVMSCDLFSGS